MRLSDLLKMQSVDSAGEPLDRVKDIRLEQRQGAWVVTDLMVGRAAFAERLGFMHGGVERPVLVARFMKRVGRHARVVPWHQATLGDDDVIRVAVRREELESPEGYR